MSYSSRTVGKMAGLALLVVSLVAALAFAPGAAAAGGTDDTVVGPNETVTGDLSAATGDVVVHGTVNGDVSALAGSVRVTGEVTGDASAAAGSLTVEGAVGGDASAAAGGVDVGERARVDGDVSAGGGSVDIAPNATVGGDASAGAGSVYVAEGATVSEDANAGGGDAEVRGTVEGDVNTGASAVLGPSAVVEGDVTYHDGIDRAGGATVGGTVEQDDDYEFDISGADVNVSPGLGPLDSLVPGAVPSELHVVYWTAIALLIGGALLALFPQFTAEIATQATTDPVRTGAAGFAAVIAAPFALFAVFMTIIGIPVALAGGALFVLLAWAGLVYGEYLVGRQVLAAAGDVNRWLALVVGVVGVELLSLIPLLGGLLKFAVLLVGLGATALAVADRWRDDGDEDAAGPTPPDPAPGTA